jgi:cystathionine beta-lyase/cystathionine gamma-synthase
MGGSLDPHAAYLIQRGLKTYFVRYQAQCESAMKIATLLEAHPAVERVHYPGIPTHPQFALANAQMKEGFGTIVTCDLKGGLAAGDKFAESLKLFALTASLGSTESLVVSPQMMRGRDLTAEQLRMSLVTEGTVRLSIGLEDIDDLVEDVSQALAAVASA